MNQSLSPHQSSLVEDHIGLAHSAAAKYFNRVHFQDREELVSVAFQGLVNAALAFDPEIRPGNDPNYDPRLGFGPYAKVRVKGAILDWFRKRDHLSKRSRQIFNEIRDLGYKERSDEEMADLIGIGSDKVRAVKLAAFNGPVSLASLGEFHEHSVGIDPALGVETSYTASSIQQAVAATIEEMDDFDKSVVVMRFYLGLPMTQIATELGVSLSRVKASHQESVATIHSVMLRAVDR